MPDGYRISMPMRLVIEPFLRSDGTVVTAYAFRRGRRATENHPGRRPAGTPRGREHGIMTAAWPSPVSASARSAANKGLYGLQMGVTAAREALADAGVGSAGHHSRWALRLRGRAGHDVRRLGLTGLRSPT